MMLIILCLDIFTILYYAIVYRTILYDDTYNRTTPRAGKRTTFLGPEQVEAFDSEVCGTRLDSQLCLRNTVVIFV